MDDYHFRPVGTEREVMRELRPYLFGKDLGYPGYERWVEETCIPDILSGYKRSILAMSNGIVVGDVIWQQHKTLARTTELKHCRVHPRAQGRYVGHFLERQAEVESRGIADRILVDTRDPQMRDFLRSVGFRITTVAPIYGDDALDYVMVKDLKNPQ